MPKFVPPKLLNIPVPALIELTKESGIKEGLTRRTIDLHRKDLQYLFRWAMQSNLCSKNPVLGFKVVDRRTQSAIRVCYDETDLKIIFEQSPVYTGCKSVHFRRRPGNLIFRDALFWFPLFSLFTGARLGEIAYATPDDFKEESGIEYFDVQDSPGKPRLKSEAAARRVPIHPELKRMGFFEYLQAARAKGWIKVFEETEGGRSLSDPQAWSNKWRDYQRSIGINDRRKVFHSFRHTFKRACRAAGIHEEVHDAITGHGSHATGRRYGGEVPLQVTGEAIARVKYNLDLSRLYVK
jgi:integrase